ncbi:MAG TPA: diguanylate cyclase [Thermoanaerobacterales bacterium]|nr:diguanylate cyclase [Thermoanaerobacterales bacterium]
MLSEYDVGTITYSVPLIDMEGNPYGVIGIDLTLDYFRKMLHYDEISDNKQGAYLLAITHEDDMVLENVISSGPMFNKIFGDSTQTVLEEKTKYDNIYRLNKGKNNMDTVYGCVHYLKLYNSNTPFEKDRWVLLGIVEETSLFKSARQILLYVVISLLLSLIVGMVGVVLAGMWFVKPITKLVGDLRSRDPEKPIVLKKTNILEIDDLACSIETLSKKVADSAAKLSKIIDMMKIPIGAFEHDLYEDRVLCTSTFFDLVGIKRMEREATEYITSTYFYEILKNLQKHPEPDMEDIYRHKKDKGSIKWLRVKIHESNGKMLGVIEDVTREVKEKRKIEYDRDHDLLTHLLNRRAFQAEVTKRLREEDVKTAAFIMWDLDNLKYINDTYGHDFGDQYIKGAAKTLSELAYYNGIVARISGDEFYAFIYGYEDKQKIRETVEMMQEKLYNTTLKLPNGTDLRIMASAGIAWYPEDSKNYHELIKYSDFAMYEVKNEDKGTISEFDKEAYNEKSLLLYSKKELDCLIQEELVDFVFQPIVDAQKGSVFAYEALMRPKLATLTSPKDIIMLADSQSKLYDIERITFFKAMEAFQSQKEVFGNAKMFINSVANHVLTDSDLQLFESKYKLDLHRIVIEIMENEQTNEQIIKKKQEMAARWNSYLALDDFGSGYNTDITLLTLSPAFVKLDMAIIRGVDRDLNRQKLLKILLQYVKDRKIKIIAEGVETKAEMNTLI